MLYGVQLWPFKQSVEKYIKIGESIGRGMINGLIGTATQNKGGSTNVRLSDLYHLRLE
jgi:hypothetical protein